MDISYLDVCSRNGSVSIYIYDSLLPINMKKIFFVFIFFLFFVIDTQAQCAMCKSVVESNLENGDTIGSGLNDGILYLMVMPYISLALIAFFWVRHNKKQKK